MVFSSTPTNCAAECAQRVRSNASKISTISLSDLVTDPLGSGQLLDQQSAANPDRGDLAVHRHQSGVSGRPRDHGHGILMSTSPEQTVHPPGACRVRWQLPLPMRLRCWSGPVLEVAGAVALPLPGSGALPLPLPGLRAG